MANKQTTPPDKSVQPLAPDQLEPSDHDRFSRLRGIGLPMALGISVAIVLILTVINMGMYFASNLSRIDLSKPKYADIRRDVNDASEEEEFDDEGPITQQTIKEAIERLQQRRDDLRALGDFTSPLLDDEQLGIGSGK